MKYVNITNRFIDRIYTKKPNHAIIKEKKTSITSNNIGCFSNTGCFMHISC